MSGLSELIARLEKATGPDRELDCAIGAWVCREVTGLLARIYSDAESAPHYSSSIDAALTLVPDGALWTLEPDHAWVRFMGKHDVEETQGGFNQRGGESTALALCIAALKSRAPNLPEGEK